MTDLSNPPLKTKLVIDPDVQAVAEFMQKNMEAVKLVAIANGVSALAQLLWGHNAQESIKTLALQAERSTKQPASSESAPDWAHVHDGSVAVTV